MSMVWGSEAGISDDVYVHRLRELLDDLPSLADEQFNGNGSAVKFQCTKLKINDDKYLQVNVGGANIPIVGTRDAVTAGNCWIDFDMGLVLFGTAPVNGTNNVVIAKTKVIRRDSVLLAALYGGLRSLYPKLFKIGLDTSIKMQTNKWDYPLPQDFNDPRVKIISIGMQEIPATTNRFIPIAGAYRVGIDTIHVPPSQNYSPNSVLRIEYAAPYRSLSELEPQAYDLPLWYAAGQLLGFGEAKRTRADNQTVASETSANPPGFQQNTGSWFMAQYRQLVASLQMPMRMPKPISTYQK